MTPASAINGAFQQWLTHAPPAPPLTHGHQWHVFLSYRSVNRAWVLQLYDALRCAGLEVFVDQFALVPGDSLVTSLQNALIQSASGIIIYSSESQGSEWCKKEYEAMISLQQRPGSMFRFVIVKLDSAELPLFAQGSLYEDFSECPEGPRGARLLRVMYGLVGKPPSEEAVRFAERINEEFKATLTKIEAARLIGDVDQLYHLGTESSLAWLTSPLLASRAAQALIDLGKTSDALDVLELADTHFPKSIRPKQLRALALARMGQWSAAQQILAELYIAGHRDPETVGIFARTWMDRYNSSRQRRHLEKSRDLYAEAFRLNPRDSYTGINAASKSILLGEVQRGREFATQVEALLGVQPIPGDYWQTATVGEVQLVREQYDEAARLYHAAVLSDPEASAAHASTLAQARLLMDKLGTPEAERQKIEHAFI